MSTEKMELKKPKVIDGKMIVPFELKSFKQDGEFFYFEGYLSTFGNEDRGGDVVMKGAFTESLKIHTPVLLWMHKMDEPLGVFDSITEDEKGLPVSGRMPLEDSLVRDRIIPQMKVGSIKSMSIGYSVWGEDGAEYSKDLNIRYLKRLFLWEGSLVTIPMNDMANLKTKYAASYQEELPIAERNKSWDCISALGRLREWAGADDDGLQDPEVQEKYSKAFLWFDSEDPDLFGSYKLPICDIIQDKLTVVPRAVFAAAGVMCGARGGIYVHYNDRPKIIRTIEKYYEKIGLESPFGKIFRIDDFQAFDERTLEKLFKDGTKMGRNSAMILVSALKLKFMRDEQKLEQRDVEKKSWSEILKDIKEINKNI